MAKTKAQTTAIQRLKEADAAVHTAQLKAKALQRSKLVPAIEKCQAADISLREIGEILGVSHVTVMRMLREDGI